MDISVQPSNNGKKPKCDCPWCEYERRLRGTALVISEKHNPAPNFAGEPKPAPQTAPAPVPSAQPATSPKPVPAPAPSPHKSITMDQALAIFSALALVVSALVYFLAPAGERQDIWLLIMMAAGYFCIETLDRII